MRPWILTAVLAVTAATLAVTLTAAEPSEAREAEPQPAPEIAPTGSPPPLPPLSSESSPDGLSTRASLDRSALLAGSVQDRYLVVEVQAPELTSTVRQPVHLAVVMDTSGSMEGESKIANAKRASASLIERLGPQDSFSLVTFSTRPNVVVSQQEVWDPTMLAARVHSVQAGGSTNIYDGLNWGINQLRSVPEGNRRLVLISDGLPTTGVTDADRIASLAQSAAARGVTVSALGLGVQFDGDLLYALSDAGGGSYLYAGRSQELAESIDGELDRTFQVAAQSARVEVSLHPAVRLHDSYGYEAWDGQVTETGFAAFLGDMHAQQTRKVVLRLQAPIEAHGDLDLATVRVSWRDPVSGEQRTRSDTVRLTLTEDPAVVEESTVPWATVRAAQAAVGHRMQRATERWRQGQTDSSVQILEQAQRWLSAVEVEVDDPALEALGDSLEKQVASYQHTQHDSWEGRDLMLQDALRAVGYVE